MKKLFCARTDGADDRRGYRVQSVERGAAARRASAVAPPPSAPAVPDPAADADTSDEKPAAQRRSLTQRIKSKLALPGQPARSFADTMDAVIPAVVVLTMTYVRSYDGSGRGSGGATGFVIDKQRGLILTNRHVVTGAPMTAQGTFQSKEEVELTPVYSDPIHDFGIFRFDPAQVKYQDLVEIPLAPERARVGVDIRVCGNDAGEKLAILSGTLARLDRNAPLYGGTYSDHNTFYLSAASNTSGGSSGSPVVDADGYAVGLNAGGAFLAASSFYLPLDRVVKALPYIKRGELPPRRTIQTVFTHQSFVEVQRLGVPDAEQAAVRAQFAGGTGMLVVSNVVPESAAEAAGLRPGDVLLRLQGRRVVSFVPLEEALDECAPDAEVRLQVQRGDAVLDMSVRTDDLHALTPTEMLEMSDGCVHALSYMQAVSSHRPPGAVVVAAQGYMLSRARVPNNVIIKAVGDQPTPDLASFAREMGKLGTRDQVSVTFTGMMDKQRKQVKAVTVDRLWFPWARRVRTFKDGVSEWEDSPWPSVSDSSKRDSKRKSSTLKAKIRDEEKVHVVQVLDGEDPRLCMVYFSCPVFISEVQSNRYFGCGSIVDADNGIVLVDRNTVPCTLGDATVVIGGTVELPARVLMVHPMHNFALVQYDASRVRVELSDAQREQRQPLDFSRVSPTELAGGMATTFVGYTAEEENPQFLRQRVGVTVVKLLQSTTANLDRFADFIFGMGIQLGATNGARNQTVMELDHNVACCGGALLDDAGLLQAFYFDFWGPRYGVPASAVVDAVARFRAGEPVRSLAADLSTLPLAKATSGLGLAQRWVGEFAALSPQRQVLAVTTVMFGAASAGRLQPGDLLLAVDERPVADFRAVELATADRERVAVTVLRDGAEHTLDVDTTQLPCSGTDRVVVWAGAILQETPLSLAFRGFMPTACEGKGVYVANLRAGSPAGLHGLQSRVFITGINDDKTPDLDSLCAAVARVPHGTFVRVHQCNMEDTQSVVTLRTDDRYWPVEQMQYDAHAYTWTFV